jgi:glycosyltransferase involved in cell wall biosynthesis
MKSSPRKIAFLFRYGCGEHVDFLPALPAIIDEFHAAKVELHHFGFRGQKAVPAELMDKMHVHEGRVRVRRSSEWDKRVKALLWLAYLPWLGRRLQREGFDRVFVDETLPLSAWLLRKSYKGHLSFTVHDFFIEMYWMKHGWLKGPIRWVQSLDLKAWRQLDLIFTRVESAKKFLILKGVDADRIRVLPDSVDLDQFRAEAESNRRAELREKWGVSAEEVLLVHHGIMHPNKGNGRLVEAMGRLKTSCPQVKLLLVGDGTEMKGLRRRQRELDLEQQVILCGWLPALSDIAEALQASDIGLVMRLGLEGDHFHVTSTLVHNLACGLPVLAVRLGGICEVVKEGETGYLFDPDCGAEFDEKLQQLIRNSARRQQMGERARALAETRFSPRVIARGYVEALV